jgi:hypothetical protein
MLDAAQRRQRRVARRTRVPRPERRGEMLGRHAEIQADAREDAMGDRVAGRHERAARRLEARPLGPLRPCAGHRPVAFDSADVEDLLEVPDVLRQLAVVESPAVVARALDAPLLGSGQREERAHLGHQPVDQIGADVVTRQLEEPPVAAGVVEPREALRVVRQPGEVDDGYGLGHELTARRAAVAGGIVERDAPVRTRAANRCTRPCAGARRRRAAGRTRRVRRRACARGCSSPVSRR